MVNLAKKRFNFVYNNKFVFIFFIGLVFIAYGQLFSSYFEADEWPGFTLNLPLTRDPFGFLKVLVKEGGPATLILQHFVPIGREIFFLDTLFFGTNFVPYAFISLFLHAINSFLVFLLIKLLLPRKFIFALLGGLFFALSPVQMHAVTWAAIYPTSVLPITLALLSIIFLKLAFLKESKKSIYISIIFLFLSLLTKETTVFLFLVLPIIVLFEKRIFSLKFLGKVFLLCLFAYIILRFLIPALLPTRLVDRQALITTDTGTIVSKDLSIHKNLFGEVVFRTVIFPFRMIGTLFLPRQTLSSIVGFTAPIVSPPLPGGDTSGQGQFIYGAGNFVIIYLASIAIIIFSLRLLLRFKKERKINEIQSMTIGYSIIVSSALLLVLIIFSFPRWGYDSYFDSRYYYPAGVGAALLFPLLIFGLGKPVSKLLRVNFQLAVFLVFLFWFINNSYVFSLVIKQFTQNFGPDRRKLVSQLKKELPRLAQNTVFYFETDGQSAFGPNLPFYTSVPQALTVVYYDKSPLPDSFFSKPLFEGQPQGYQYSEGRGFGYYTSKKDLSIALASNYFSIEDVYGFYYYAKDIKLKNINSQIREEMSNYLKKSDFHDWKSFQDSLSKIKFLYPSSVNVEEEKSNDPNIIESFLIADTKFSADISIINVPPSFDVHDTLKFLNQKNNVIEKKVIFDKYRFNNAIMVDGGNPAYFMRLGDLFLYVKTENSSKEGLDLLERILGSLEIVK